MTWNIGKFHTNLHSFWESENLPKVFLAKIIPHKSTVLCLLKQKRSKNGGSGKLFSYVIVEGALTLLLEGVILLV